MPSLAEDYDKRFFQMHEPWRGEYNFIAELLAERLRFDSVLDLGCGNGYIISRLAELGKTVKGVDGSREATQFYPQAIVADLRTPHDFGLHDLVICTEVAEHIAEQDSETLLDNIIVNTRGLVFFTAATPMQGGGDKPNQGGHHHVNEQPHEYWIEKFKARRFSMNVPESLHFRELLRERLKKLFWFPQNAMVFNAQD